MKLTYYGHACFMVEAAGIKLLFDPFISGNDNAKSIDIQSIEADYILISHGHGDHIADRQIRSGWGYSALQSDHTRVG